MPRLIFLLLLSLVGVLVSTLAAGIGDLPANAAGLPHATIDGLFIGGDGAARVSALGPWPYLFQFFTLSAGAVLIAMGVPRARRSAAVLAGFAAVWAVTVLVWSAVWFTYTGNLNTAAVPLFIGFPVPTAWMLYGVWPSLALFSVLYVVLFDRIVLPPESEEGFEKLLLDDQQDAL